jgi:hypothetical protein
MGAEDEKYQREDVMGRRPRPRDATRGVRPGARGRPMPITPGTRLDLPPIFRAEETAARVR